jgi:branched-chain amino acid transport system substrate-binding protein
MIYFKIVFAVLLGFLTSFSAVAGASSPEPLTIGLILAQTGIAADDNRPGTIAASLAVKEINRQGGVLGRPLKIIEIDNQSTPIGSKQAAEDAIRHNVIAVIGPYWSSHALAAAPVLQAAGIPMITPTGSSPEITRCGNYIFRACFSDSFQGRVLAEFARKQLQSQSAAILINANEQYSMTLADFFKSHYIQNGGQIVWEGFYSGKAVDFSDILTEIKRIRPDVCFIPGYSRDSGFLIKQAVGMDIHSHFIGGDGWGEQILKYSGGAVEGAYFSTHWHPDIKSAMNSHLAAVYAREFAEPIPNDIRFPLTYDAVNLLADAIQRSGSAERVGIRDSLARTSGFKGAAGTITFDENRDPIQKEAVFMQYLKGKWTYLTSFVP